jgi:ABC-2 type transport system permease protein/lipopolysaccharide transport system permease protein
MIDAAVDAVISCVVLVLLFPLTGFAPKVQAFYVPLLMIPLLAFTLGLMLIISVVVVYLRDLRLVLPLVVQMGLFATPVVYSPASLVHSKLLLAGYSALNPLVPVLDGLRRTVLLGTSPEWGSYAVGTVSSLIVLVVGFAVFKRMETGIADVA